MQARLTQLRYIQPIEEDIEHIITRISTETQTQPLGISNMDEIKKFDKKCPDMKDIIVNSLLSELVKNKIVIIGHAAHARIRVKRV